MLQLSAKIGLKVLNGGLFVSAGRGSHPERVIDSYELIFVRKGALAIAESSRRFDVSAGQTLLLWPGRRHGGVTPYGRATSFYWVHFRVPNRRASAQLTVPQHTRVARPARLTELFHRFLDDQESGRLGALDAAGLVLLMLCEVARAESAETTQSSALAGRVEEHVSRHLAQPLSTSRIARALRVNPDYLNRVFRRLRGATITEHIHQRRLHDAELMLRESTDSVLEIASACGFASTSYFRRVFARHHGVSPSSYRNLYARTHVNVR
jgi:AraC-like DNA-binding protein